MTAAGIVNEQSRLVGTWKLLDWHNQSASGEKHYPLGRDASGFISYSADGFVFVQMSASGRTPYEVNDPFGGTDTEAGSAMRSHITYAGSYKLENDQAIHQVAQSSCPNWVGTKQVRKVQFDGEQLVLSAEGAVFHGEAVTAILTWERA